MDALSSEKFLIRGSNDVSSLDSITWLILSKKLQISASMTESVFSSSAQAIIQKPLALESDETSAQLSTEQFNDYYELEWTANEINSKNYMRVSVSSSLTRWETMTRIPSIGCPPISRRTSA